MTDGELAALHGECFQTPRPWSADEFAQLLADPSIRLITRDGGFTMIRLVADESEILTLAVAPDMRRMGIGTALVAESVANARFAGANRIFLEVSGENTAARALYQQAGFRVLGRRKAYYQAPDGHHIDALTLGKAL